jgi:hypothetical protein
MLQKIQDRFTGAVALLILFAHEKGYTLSFGDAWARDGHKTKSLHYTRQAIDLNLFKDGKYLPRTEDHARLGAFWEGLHPNCRWGGHFKKPDGNHYEMIEEKNGTN